MARSAGIPARFIIGFPIPAAPEGLVPGYHCWAEFFDPDRGWVGLDASEAWMNKQPEDYYGKLPNDRIEFSLGRDLVLEPPQRGEALNYFIYPYIEIDGKESKDFTTEFRFSKLDTGGAPAGS
jgi:transglutaminase-like putative cysteine protease